MSLLVTNLFAFAGCAQAVDEIPGVPYLGGSLVFCFPLESVTELKRS